MLTLADARQGLTALRRLLLPPVCLICGGSGRGRLDCCADCEAGLPAAVSGCRRCGLELADTVARCGHCQRRPPAFDRCRAGFAYRDEIESLVQRFKFRRDLAAGRVLAELAARRLLAVGVQRPDALVPVPLHWRRLLWRGFNQSELLAADLGRALGGIPVERMLSRIRATPAQSTLAAARRRSNVQRAFRALPGAAQARSVALIDDVMTTGSTLNACARALKQAGVDYVEVWVIARA